MALVPNATPITVLASRKASYAPTLSPDGIATLPSGTAAAFFPDGVVDTVAANAVAAGIVSASGVLSPVDLVPGTIYHVTTTPAAGFTSGRFSAGNIVGPVIKPGDNVTGA